MTQHVEPAGQLRAVGSIEVRSFIQSSTGAWTLHRRTRVRNTLTLQLQQLVPLLLAQRADSPAQWGMVHSLRVGTGTTPPERKDFNLAAPLLGKRLSDTNKVSTLPGEIAFFATLEKGDGDGQTIREVALFTRGRTDDPFAAPGRSIDTPMMIGRQIVADEFKDPLKRLEITYRIAFTVE